MEFNNKVIVVTGAGGGVGRELVIQLLKKGASVAAVDINRSALEETKSFAKDYSYKLSLHVIDITNKDVVNSLPHEVIEVHGRVDGLINNAGIIQPFKTVTDLSDTEIQRVMNINFFGLTYMTRAFLPYISHSKSGCIGNVSSMGGFLPVPGQGLYGASKAAVKIFTESLRMELSKTNIKVSIIFPGGIETGIMKNSGLEEEEKAAKKENNSKIKLTQPSEAASIIINGIEKGRAKILVGTDAKLMDFLYRVAPLKACNLIANVMSKNHGGILSTTEKLQGEI